MYSASVLLLSAGSLSLVLDDSLTDLFELGFGQGDKGRSELPGLCLVLNEVSCGAVSHDTAELFVRRVVYVQLN